MNNKNDSSLGKYQLVEKIASGGMAEVFRAKAFGTEGFEKPVAIKRILPHLSSQKDFITMLSDEAKTVVRLAHTNIVQVYDFEQDDGIYYLAMEFVDGTDLATLIANVRSKNTNLPPDIAAWIIRDVARGLSYAHQKKNDDGTPLEIIHRDISPANILISRSGEVKLTDFGIAKAMTNMYTTEQGVLKGKIAYMSPEQALGKELFATSDIFSLGLVLYEILTGNRFFKGESQTEILRQVQEKRIDEKDISAEIPAALRKLICQMLAHDASLRLQFAADVEERLNIYLSMTAPNLTMSRIATHIKPFLPPEPVWKPLSLVTSLVPEQYKPMAEKVAKRATAFKTVLIVLFVCSLFVGDLLKPLFSSLSFYLVLLCLAVGAGLFFYAKKNLNKISFEELLNSNFGIASILVGASLLIWGFIGIFQVVTPSRGLVASTVPGISSLQDSFASLLGKVSAIEKTTNQIASDVKDIKAAIESLSNKESLVSSPSSPSEFYHNARVYQLRGLNQQALESYKKFIELAPDYIDAHLTAQILSRDTPGAPQLNGWYDLLSAKYPKDTIVKAASALLKNGEARTNVLEEVIKSDPKNPVPILLLANEYYEAGFIGKTEKYTRHMEELFKNIKAAVASNTVQNYFIDKMMFEKELEPMKGFERYVLSMGADWDKPPIRIDVTETDYGLSVYFSPKEGGVKKILYSVDKEEPMQETGYELGVINPITNLPHPKTQLMIPILEGKHTIFAKYVDKDGNESPVVKLEHESLPLRVVARAIGLTYGKSTTDMRIRFMPKNGSEFKKYLFSIDSEALDQKSETDEAKVKDVTIGTHTLFVKAINRSNKETPVYKFDIATE